MFKLIKKIIKRQNFLKKELKRLQEKYNEIYFDNWTMYYIVSCMKTNYEGAKGAMEQILKINKIEEARYYAKIGIMYMNMRQDKIKQQFNEVLLKKKFIDN